MAIEKWFLVVCDTCGSRDDPNDESEQTVRQVLIYLKTLGWAHENATAITAARDLCPGCNPRNKPTPQPVDPRQTSLF